MRRVLIDTNVILDYLLAREQFKEEAKRVLELAAFDNNYEFVSSSAVTDIFYQMRKELRDSYAAQSRLRDLLQILTILDVTKREIFHALDLHWKDFEDAVQYAAALENNLDAVVTRNKKDFEGGPIPVLTLVY